MNSFTRTAMVIVAMLSCPAMTLAKGITYDCDTPADHFSALILPTGNGPFTVSGTMQMIRMEQGNGYVPSARIQIASATPPGGQASAFAGLTLSALPIDPKASPTGASAIEMLAWTVVGKEDEGLPLSMLAKPGTPRTFTLTWDGSAVTVTTDKDTRTFAVALTDPVVRVICSTGEVMFTDVVIAPK